MNLLSNSIKFTDRGQVGLHILRLDATFSHCRLRFEVIDTAAGIAPDMPPQLFTPFAQADASTTRRFGGTGPERPKTQHRAANNAQMESPTVVQPSRENDPPESTQLTPFCPDPALVKRVQQALKAAGFDPGKIDSEYGPHTLAAVVAFQSSQKLVADGVVGPAAAMKLAVE